MGADVIKVEPPLGDGIRHTMEPIVPGESKGFTLVNRGKRSICLDITREEARPVLRSARGLGRCRDGLAEARRSPALSPRLRGPSRHESAHRLSGAFAARAQRTLGDGPGYDVIVQGMSGTAVTTARERDGAPINIRPAFNDTGTGALSALAVVAALRHRDLTGEGQRVETSLLATAMALGHQLLSWFAATDPPADEAFAVARAEAQKREQGLRSSARSGSGTTSAGASRTSTSATTGQQMGSSRSAA